MSNLIKNAASIAKIFAGEKWGNVIDEASNLATNYSTDRSGALNALKDMGGTTQDIKKMLDLAQKDSKVSTFFNMLGVSKNSIQGLGQELLNNQIDVNSPQIQQPTTNSSQLNEIQRRLAALR